MCVFPAGLRAQGDGGRNAGPESRAHHGFCNPMPPSTSAHGRYDSPPSPTPRTPVSGVLSSGSHGAAPMGWELGWGRAGRDILLNRREDGGCKEPGSGGSHVFRSKSPTWPACWPVWLKCLGGPCVKGPGCSRDWSRPMGVPFAAMPFAALPWPQASAGRPD